MIFSLLKVEVFPVLLIKKTMKTRLQILICSYKFLKDKALEFIAFSRGKGRHLAIKVMNLQCYFI